MIEVTLVSGDTGYIFIKYITTIFPAQGEKFRNYTCISLSGDDYVLVREPVEEIVRRILVEKVQGGEFNGDTGP